MSRQSRSYQLFLPFLDKDPGNLCDQDYFDVMRHFFSSIYTINRLHAQVQSNADILLSNTVNESFMKAEFSDLEMQRLRQWFMDPRFQVILASLYNWASGCHGHLSYLFHAKHHIQVTHNHGHADIRIIQSPLVLLHNFLAADFLDKGPVSNNIDMMTFLLRGVDEAACHAFFDNILRFIEINALLETQFTGKSVLEICDRDIAPITQSVPLSSLKLIKTVHAQFTDWLDELENAPLNRVIHFVLRLYDTYRKNKTLTQEEVNALLHLTPFYGLSHITDTNESLWIAQFIKILMTVLFMIKRANDFSENILEKLYATFGSDQQALLDRAIRSFRNDPFFQLLWDHLVVLLHPIENKNDILEGRMQELSVEVVVVIAHNLIDMWNIKQCQEAGSVLHRTLSLQQADSFLSDTHHARVFSEKKKASNQKINMFYRNVNRRVSKTYEEGLSAGIAKGRKAYQSLVYSRLKKIGFSFLLALGIAALTYLTVQTLGAVLVIAALVWAGAGAVAGVGAAGLMYQYKSKIKALFKKRRGEEDSLGQQRHIPPALSQIPVSEEAQLVLVTDSVNKEEAERKIVMEFNIGGISNSEGCCDDYLDALHPMRQASIEKSDALSIRSLTRGTGNIFPQNRSVSSFTLHPPLLEVCDEQDDYGWRYT